MFWTVTLELLKGFSKTLELFALTLVFALPLGLIISFGSRSKFLPLRWLCRFVVWVIRGTPLMLQLIVVFYVPGMVGMWARNQETVNWFVAWLAEWKVMDRFLAAVIAFIINYACYFSEIFRGGIESVSVGQYEAGQVLGMTKWDIFFRVTLLQVVKNILPPMGNEIITLVKDTSLARTISVLEIIWFADNLTKQQAILWPPFYAGVFFLVFNGLLTVLFRQCEKRLSRWR